jgi:uncharacterized protein
MKAFRPLYLITVTLSLMLMSCGNKEAAAGETITGIKEEKGDTLLNGKPIPAPSGYISDLEKILTDAQKHSLDSVIRYFEKAKGVEIGIITIDSSLSTQDQLDENTLLIARSWKVGKADKNNGILIGLSASLRAVRIQNGYGIEKDLTNEETDAIVDEIMIPHFKNAEYYEGLMDAIQAIMSNLK